MNGFDSRLGVGGGGIKEEEHPYDVAPCSSLAVCSTLNVGAAGTIWGLSYAPQDARKFGLTGINRAGFVARQVAKSTFQCALIGGVCAATHCGIKRYRRKDDWVNGLVSGVVTGVAFAAVSRSWRQLIPTVCLISALRIAMDHRRKDVRAS
ncbi:hypothetical protein ACLB2K_014318 [Fragaria x ananassa]